MGPRSITGHIPFDTVRASRRRSTGSEACSRSGSRLIIARNFRARSTGLVSRSTLSTRSSPSRCTGLATCTQWLLHILLCADHLADLHDYRMRWSSALPRRGCQEPGEQLPKVRKTVQLRSSSDILGPGGITTPRCVLPRARIWGLLNKYWGFDAEQQEEIRAQDSGCYRCSWMPDHEQRWGHCSRTVVGDASSSSNAQDELRDEHLFQHQGDYVHITAGEASAHGWWTTNDPYLLDKTGTVVVELQYLTESGWQTVVTGPPRSIRPNQTSKRANARIACRTTAPLGEWRSVVDVDIDWVIDDSNVLITPVRLLPCHP